MTEEFIKVPRLYQVELSKEEQRFVDEIDVIRTYLMSHHGYILNTITRLERMGKETWGALSSVNDIREVIVPRINPINGEFVKLDDKETSPKE